MRCLTLLRSDWPAFVAAVAAPTPSGFLFVMQGAGAWAEVSLPVLGWRLISCARVVLGQCLKHRQTHKNLSCGSMLG